MNELKASPQVEHGFTKIANELLDVMKKYPFNGSEFRILCVVISKTYGWRKTKDVIPYSQISKSTNLNLRYVKKIVKRLVMDSVLFKEPSPDGNILSLNKNYFSWRLWKNQVSNSKIDTTIVTALTPNEVSGMTPKLVSEETLSK